MLHLYQTPWTGLVSAHQPLIDMATPKSERGPNVQAGHGKRLTDAFDNVPISKKSRLSVVSRLNESADVSPAEDGNGTGSLLDPDEVCSDLNSWLTIASTCAAS